MAFAPDDDFVDYSEAAGWAGDLDDVIDALEELCDAGHPDVVAVLTEHAHRRADEAIQYVDDYVRHEASHDRVEMKELHLRPVAAGR